jgi:hypothetical protein
MPIQPPQPADNQTVIVVVLIIASLCAIYWRLALRMIAIILVAVAVLGTIAGLHGLHITR